ncbi:hypothetical protein KSB_53240 [Ktedonobacter robiniae]|uniref:Integrase n=1 Tax=Ktedonobacter robiniae TaxID=2778365 RepID=A0ABQ3UVH3_9CHLR|nr:hypothetical protein KSB_53240 [Ktedonobacter robiniae]
MTKGSLVVYGTAIKYRYYVALPQKNGELHAPIQQYKRGDKNEKRAHTEDSTE